MGIDLLDSFVYGHVVHETSFPFSTSEQAAEPSRSILEHIATNEYPHLAEIGENALTHEYSFDNVFEYGLDLILDALAKQAAVEPGVSTN